MTGDFKLGVRTVSNLKRYMASLVIAAFAALLLLVGLLAATVWKPSQQVEASVQSTQPFVMTRTGVLPLYNKSVTVTVTSADPSQKIWMAVGSAQDIKGWLGDRPYDEIMGLEDLTTLKVVGHQGAQDSAQSGETPQSGGQAAATPTPAVDPTVDLAAQSGAQSGDAVPSPITSDMWKTLREGTGSITMELLSSDAESSLLITADGVSPAPELTLTWAFPQPNILGWVSFSLGAVVLVLAGLVASLTYRRQIKRRRRAETLREAESADVTETAAIPVITAEVAPEQEEDSASVRAEDDPAPSTDPEPQDDPGEPGSDADAPQEPEAASEPTPEAKTDRTESISTDSGMINLAALQGGAVYPTRRALREAQSRGVERVIVEGREFQTGSTPIVRAQKDDESDSGSTLKDSVSSVLSKRSARAPKWNEAFTRRRKGTEEEPGDTGDTLSNESEGTPDE